MTARVELPCCQPGPPGANREPRPHRAPQRCQLCALPSPPHATMAPRASCRHGLAPLLLLAVAGAAAAAPTGLGYQVPVTFQHGGEAQGAPPPRVCGRRRRGSCPARHEWCVRCSTLCVHLPPPAVASGDPQGNSIILWTRCVAGSSGAAASGGACPRVAAGTPRHRRMLPAGGCSFGPPPPRPSHAPQGHP